MAEDAIVWFTLLSILPSLTGGIVTKANTCEQNSFGFYKACKGAWYAQRLHNAIQLKVVHKEAVYRGEHSAADLIIVSSVGYSVSCAGLRFGAGARADTLKFTESHILSLRS